MHMYASVAEAFQTIHSHHPGNFPSVGMGPGPSLSVARSANGVPSIFGWTWRPGKVGYSAVDPASLSFK